VLRAASQRLGTSPEINEALLLSETEEDWSHGREVFDRLRQRSLDKDAPLAEEQALLFRLAELVAKVAHNAAGMRPPFDHDSGWRIAPMTHRLFTVTGDPQLREQLTEALGGWPQDI
jgi:deoxyribonuclease V